MKPQESDTCNMYPTIVVFNPWIMRHKVGHRSNLLGQATTKLPYLKRFTEVGDDGIEVTGRKKLCSR